MDGLDPSYPSRVCPKCWREFARLSSAGQICLTRAGGTKGKCKVSTDGLSGLCAVAPTLTPPVMRRHRLNVSMNSSHDMRRVGIH